MPASVAWKRLLGDVVEKLGLMKCATPTAATANPANLAARDPPDLLVGMADPL
jgi:hypothetical protein